MVNDNAGRTASSSSGRSAQERVLETFPQGVFLSLVSQTSVHRQDKTRILQRLDQKVSNQCQVKGRLMSGQRSTLERDLETFPQGVFLSLVSQTSVHRQDKTRILQRLDQKVSNQCHVKGQLMSGQRSTHDRVLETFPQGVFLSLVSQTSVHRQDKTRILQRLDQKVSNQWQVKGQLMSGRRSTHEGVLEMLPQGVFLSLVSQTSVHRQDKTRILQRLDQKVRNQCQVKGRGAPNF